MACRRSPSQCWHLNADGMCFVRLAWQTWRLDHQQDPISPFKCSICNFGKQIKACAWSESIALDAIDSLKQPGTFKGLFELRLTVLESSTLIYYTGSMSVCMSLHSPQYHDWSFFKELILADLLQNCLCCLALLLFPLCRRHGNQVFWGHFPRSACIWERQFLPKSSRVVGGFHYKGASFLANSFILQISVATFILVVRSSTHAVAFDIEGRHRRTS